MLKQYTVYASVRTEGALGLFSQAVEFRLMLEGESRPVFGSTLLNQAISAIRHLGYETHHIQTIVES